MSSIRSNLLLNSSCETLQPSYKPKSKLSNRGGSMYVGFCESDSSKLTKLTGEEARKLLLCSTIGEEVETIGCERVKDQKFREQQYFHH